VYSTGAYLDVPNIVFDRAGAASSNWGDSDPGMCSWLPP